MFIAGTYDNRLAICLFLLYFDFKEKYFRNVPEDNQNKEKEMWRTWARYLLGAVSIGVAAYCVRSFGLINPATVVWLTILILMVDEIFLFASPAYRWVRGIVGIFLIGSGIYFALLNQGISWWITYFFMIGAVFLANAALKTREQWFMWGSILLLLSLLFPLLFGGLILLDHAVFWSGGGAGVALILWGLFVVPMRRRSRLPK